MNMFGFIIKRIAFTLLSIPIIIWLMLALTRISPVDPIEQLIDANDFSTDRLEYAEIYSNTAKRYKLAKPNFYFTLTRSNYTKDYYSLSNPIQKQLYTILLQSNYSYEDTENLYLFLQRISAKNPDNELAKFHNYRTKSDLFTFLEKHLEQGEESTNTEELKTHLDSLKSSKSSSYSFLPKLIYFGKDNLFHSNFASLLTFNWGTSIIDGKTAKTKIFPALKITLLLLFMSMILGYGVGILLGIWMHRKHSFFNKAIEQFLYIIKSVPLFVLALFLLVAFTTAEFSPFLKIFPSVNAYGWSSSNGFFANLSRNFNQLILPTICVALYSAAYISRQVKSTLNREKIAQYNTTANMKGIHKSGLFSHRFKNIKGILITMIGNGLISSFSGALIIEYIFNIPGIGRLLLSSIRQNDLSVLLPIILLLFLISSTVLLISDLLYKRFNPKISLSYE